jgi:LuxR family maltose regulon positive regulatory protein
MPDVEAALLAVAQGFLRGERLVQRIAPDLLASLALASSPSSPHDILIGALHPERSIVEPRMDSPVAAMLSASEMRVATFLTAGDSEPHIAHALGVSLETIKTHRKRIYEKVGAASRAALAPLFAPGRGP